MSPTTPNTETGYSESDYAMSRPAFDVARHDICSTDGGTGFYVVHVADAMWPQTSASAARPGCTAATGALVRTTLGPVSLGMTRARARRAFVSSSLRGRRNMDFFCLRPNGIRVAHPSAAVLRHLSGQTRRRVHGRVVLALSANPDYSLLGVRPGNALGPVAGRPHTGSGLQIGKNRRYVLPAGASRGVLKVRNGVIEEIGIANRSLTAGLGAQRLLGGLN